MRVIGTVLGLVIAFGFAAASFGAIVDLSVTGGQLSGNVGTVLDAVPLLYVAAIVPLVIAGAVIVIARK